MGPNDTDPEELVGEQLRFYREDATAFEAWRVDVFEAGGGGAVGEAQRTERRRVLAALRDFTPRGRVLELACGTGAFTGALLDHADHLTAVDGSPESLAIARAKLRDRSERLTFVEADLFTWRPERRYDVVFFGYWLTHVPPSRFEPFWEAVRDALTPGGRVFFVDSGATPAPDESTSDGYRERDDLAAGVSHRELNGRGYRVVKVVWQPEALEARLTALGWRASIQRLDRCIWGRASPRA